MNASGSSGQKNGRITLKGKSLELVTQYAGEIVFKDTFPDPSSPSRQELMKLIASLHPKTINTEDARSFLLAELYLFATSANDVGQRCPSDSEQPALQAAFAARLQAQIEALPGCYTVRIELPSFPSLPATTLSVSDGVRLRLHPNSGDSSAAKFTSLAALARVSSLHEVDPSSAGSFLEIDVEGFCDGSSESSAAARCISIAKQCTFLLVASGAAHNGWETKIASARFSPSPYGSSGTEFSIPHSVSRCFGTLAPTASNWKIRDLGKGHSLLGAPERSPENDAERLEALGQSLWPSVDSWPAVITKTSRALPRQWSGIKTLRLLTTKPSPTWPLASA